MAALSGLSGQQTSFAIAFGEMKLRKQMNDQMMRQMTIDNLLAYLHSSYEKRHSEGVAKNARNQQNIIKGGTVAATLGLSAGFDYMNQVPGLPQGNLDQAVWPNSAPQAGGDFFGSESMRGAMYA